MTGATLYLWLDGDAREALTFYHAVFGGELQLHTFADFGRTDGPAEAVAHGVLRGPVTLYGADTGRDEHVPRLAGACLALLGTAAPEVLTRWFAELSDGGQVVEPLQARAWDATDGQVVDRHGIRWLIGFEHTT